MSTSTGDEDAVTAGPAPTAGVPRRATALLTLAAVAVAFAAADTYVVVLALPEMMSSVGLPITALQRAAPIVSGFLLGYVAVLPLIGRIADLRGRVPVLLASLVVFAFGSAATVLTYDLGSLVAGRFVQGVGAGGLVPVTLALVADLYPVERRGVPLGLVSAVQEIGSVLGPLFGAAVLAIAPWQGIFAINLVVGVLLAVALWALTRREPLPGPDGDPDADPGPAGAAVTTERGRRPDLPGAVLLLVAAGCACVTMIRPAPLMRDLTWGALFVPYAGTNRWVTPIGLTTVVALLLALGWWLVAPRLSVRPLLDLSAWWRILREADLPGAGLLALVLGGIILAFATADPAVAVLSPQGPWFLAGAAVAAVVLALHLRRAANPLIPRDAFGATAAWGALVVSFFVGSALIAALIDIPLFARTTVYPQSQLLAALVLVRFLLALPVGAVLGGLLLRRLGPGVVTAVGMVAAAASFLAMARWDADSLAGWPANVPLLVGGLGFGLALAPVNAALLAATPAPVHGVASALVVVARMVGMLVGISALTTIGLRRFYALPEGMSTLERGIAQEHAVFVGAAVCAAIAGLAALALFRRAPVVEQVGRAPHEAR